MQVSQRSCLLIRNVESLWLNLEVCTVDFFVVNVKLNPLPKLLGWAEKFSEKMYLISKIEMVSVYI